MKQNFKVTATWDAEAEVFTSTSNIPGLVVEAETFEEFVSLVEALAPEMLEANMPSAKRPFVFDIELHRTLAGLNCAKRFLSRFDKDFSGSRL